MVELKNIGPHQPYGMIVDVDEERAKDLLESKDYILVKTSSKVIEKTKEVIKNDDII